MGTRLTACLRRWTGAGAVFAPACLALLLVLALVGGKPVAAMELVREHAADGPTLLLQGRIVEGDGTRVAAYLGAHPEIREVRLHSPGGRLSEGIAIGERLRRLSLVTRVPPGASCVSACVWAFLGGVIRIVDADAKMGVHMSSVIFNEELIARIKEDLVGRSEKDIDIPLRYVMAKIEKAAARAAADKAEHLVRMGASLRLLAPGLDTDHWDIHWLTKKELRDYNVVNVE